MSRRNRKSKSRTIENPVGFISVAECQSLGIDPSGITNHDAVRFGRHILNHLPEAKGLRLLMHNTVLERWGLLTMVADLYHEPLQQQLESDLAQGYIPLAYVVVGQKACMTIPSVGAIAILKTQRAYHEYCDAAFNKVNELLDQTPIEIRDMPAPPTAPAGG